MQQKKVGWEVIFSELGFAGSGARKPRREFERSALEPFFHVFLSLNGVYCVVKLPHKSQCKTYRICQGKSNHTLARCVIFYQHCYITKIYKAKKSSNIKMIHFKCIIFLPTLTCKLAKEYEITQHLIITSI